MMVRGWPACGVAVAMLVALTSLASLGADALTAFGKSQNTDTKAPAPKVQKGRLCQGPADCAGMPATSCALSATDGKRHCLCRDGSPPVNSKCAVIPNVPGRPCTEHADCILNADCLVSNETHKRSCTCKDGYEFDPSVDDSLCSGCSALWPCVVTLLVAFLVLAITEPRANSVSS